MLRHIAQRHVPPGAHCLALPHHGSREPLPHTHHAQPTSKTRLFKRFSKAKNKGYTFSFGNEEGKIFIFCPITFAIQRNRSMATSYRILKNCN